VCIDQLEQGIARADQAYRVPALDLEPVNCGDDDGRHQALAGSSECIQIKADQLGPECDLRADLDEHLKAPPSQLHRVYAHVNEHIEALRVRIETACPLGQRP